MSSPFRKWFDVFYEVNIVSGLTLSALLCLWGLTVYGQCGYSSGEGCSSVNYGNAFMASTNDAATIEYDNYTSSYHATAVRQYSGVFKIWGQDMSESGTSDVLTPIELTGDNFSALGLAEVYKVTGASSGSHGNQFVALTSDGLYVWGFIAQLISSSLISSFEFQKLTVNGKTDGLPPGVSPSDVKMMTSTSRRISSSAREGSLLIVTCDGDVWMLSLNSNMRGIGSSSSNETTWYRVTTNQSGNPYLTDVVAARVAGGTAMALRGDGTIWTWGATTFLGNGSSATSRTRAAEMSKPTGTIKMIGVTASTPDNSPEPSSYYVLMTNGNLYSMGNNAQRQLGDWTTNSSSSWIQPRYTSTSGPVMNDIHWISPNEHDGRFPAINVLTSSSTLYAFGRSEENMIGRGNNVSANPGIPAGLTTASVVTSVHTGGHTTMITTDCQTNFGYVGHRVDGSMGNGSGEDIYESTYTYNTAYVPVCGSNVPHVTVTPPIFAPNGNYCVGVVYNFTVSPAGGTLTGPASAVITQNSASDYSVRFTSAGLGTLTYQPPVGDCGIAPLPFPFSYQASACLSDLAITKNVNTLTQNVGGQVTFTVVARNNGPRSNSSVIVNDLLPEGYNYVSHTATNGNGTYSSSTGEWNIGTLANGVSRTLTITATVNATGEHSNTASITGALTDPIGTNNSASASVTPVSIDSDLRIVKLANNMNPAVGSQVIFTITASNLGPSTAMGVVVNDLLPTGYTLVNGTASTGTWSSPNWAIGNLANGANATLTITALVNATGSYTNTASITSSTPDPVTSNNSSTVTPNVDLCTITPSVIRK